MSSTLPNKSIIKYCVSNKLANPPKWMADNICYETITGSVAYGVSSDTSDCDIYSFCIPKKELIWPHLAGVIPGFGTQIQHFEQYQQHGIEDPSAQGGKGKVYDLTVYSIVKYFHLLMGGNPNIIDSIFTPMDCVVYANPIAIRLREHRKMFLHKGAWHTFKGYAYSQLGKLKNKNPIGSRKNKIDAQIEQGLPGYDFKFAYHIVRLLNEVEHIMVEGDLDLRRNREQLKSIRRGEWTLDQISDYFTKKQSELESVYLSSKLPYSPDEEKIKTLLLECLEMHYGSLDKATIIVEGRGDLAWREIINIAERELAR